MSQKFFFFDFDGPLLDVSEKYYRTYFDLLQQGQFNALNKTLYWELKRNKTPEKEIHLLTHATVPNYKENRKNLIETDHYQHLDTLQESAKEVLFKAKQQGKVFLITLRNSHKQVLKQLHWLGIDQFFDAVLSSGLETDPRWQIKVDLLMDHFKGNIPMDSLFIGDTETDILAGKQLKSKTVAVLDGIRNYEKIKSASPDYIIPSIKDILHLHLI